MNTLLLLSLSVSMSTPQLGERPRLPGIEDPELDLRLLGMEEVEPAEAVRLAVEAEGVPEMLEEMLRVCHRESGCGRWGHVGVHKGDAGAGRNTYRAAVRKGWLHPDECEEHRPGRPWGRYSTFGIMGTRSSWVLHHIEDEFGRCAAPELLDHPGPAALAGVRWAKACRKVVVRQTRRGQRLVKVPGCTCRDRTRMWAGAGRFDERSHAHQRQAVERQCGPQPPLSPWLVFADWAAAMRSTVFTFLLELDGLQSLQQERSTA